MGGYYNAKKALAKAMKIDLKKFTFNHLFIEALILATVVLILYKIYNI